MRTSLLLLLLATLVACCQSLPDAGDNNRVLSAPTHRFLRDGMHATDKDISTAAGDEDEERGLAIVAKLKATAKKFPSLDKYRTLLRKNPDPKKLESMVKSDPQLSKLKSTVKSSGLKITTRDIQRMQSIAAKTPSVAKRSKMLIVFLLSCVVLGAGGYASYALIKELTASGSTAPVGRQIQT